VQIDPAKPQKAFAQDRAETTASDIEARAMKIKPLDVSFQ